MKAKVFKSPPLSEAESDNLIRVLSRCTKTMSIGLLVILIASIIILACVPPVSRDALTHHLAVPKLYLKYGGLCEIPSIEFSYYPMNLDLLYLIPLYWQNDILPKFIHFVFALLTTGLIFTYLKKKLGIGWSLFGSLFFLSLPIIVKLSITVYVDLGLVYFSTAALIYLLKWCEKCSQSKYLILSAMFCGLALGTKYNGLLVLFILTLFVPLIFMRQSAPRDVVADTAGHPNRLPKPLRALGFGALFFGLAVLVFSPWLIRNYVWTANPIYPLYNNVFNPPQQVSPDAQTVSPINGSAAEHQQPLKAKSTPWSPFAVRKVLYGESWWDIGLLPIRIFFQGQDDTPQYFDGKLNPFLFILPFFAFIGIKSNPSSWRRELKILTFFAIIYLGYAFANYSIRIRYIAPIIPPLIILATVGLHQIAGLIVKGSGKHRGWIAAGGILVVATLALSYNAVYIIQQFRQVDPISYLCGRISRDDYIAKYRPEYTVYQYANQHLTDRAKVMGLFLGNRRYYSDRELIFNVHAFGKIVRAAESDNAVVSGLAGQGFTHLIIRYDLFNQWTQRQLNNRQKHILKRFFERHAAQLLSRNGYGLFEIQNNHGGP